MIEDLTRDLEVPLTARYHSQAVEDVLQCIEDGVFCALLGPRLCGKTVLLRFVERILCESLGLTCAYIDLLPMSASTLQEFFANLINLTQRRIAEQTGYWVPALDASEASSAVFRGFMSDCVTQLERDIVLIIEHLEAVPTDLVQALLTSLRAAYMDQQTLDYRATVVVSGALSLASLTVGESSPFRGIARRVFLGDLPAEDSQAMIAEYFQHEEVSLTPHAHRTLLEASQGDAFLIRTLCQRVKELSIERSLPRLGAGNINLITRRFLRSEVFRYAPLLEAVRMIEEDPDLLTCILRLLDQETVRKAELPLPLSPDLDPLYLTGVVENVGGESYRVQNSIYRHFLEHHFHPGRVGHMLAMAGRWDSAIDYLENGALEGDESSRAELLSAAITSMFAADDPAHAAHFLIRGLSSAFGVRQAQVWIAPENEKHLRLVRSMGMSENGAAPQGTIIASDADQLEARAYRQAISMRGGETNSRVRRAIPLMLPGRKPIGVVSVWEEGVVGRILDQRRRDLKILAFLNQAARALQTVSTRRQELTLAGRMQASLLPEAPPVIPGWQFTAAWLPARETSGDFYDFIPLPGGKIGLVIADVVDKGMGAALYMALSRTLLRTYAADFPTKPEHALQAANMRLIQDANAGHFVTMFYGILQPKTGKLNYTNAGHSPPCLISPESDKIELLHRTGMAIGVSDDSAWQGAEITIPPGGTLVLYTDGMIDAQNANLEYYGEQRVRHILLAHSGTQAEELQSSLLADMQEFCGSEPQADDITILVASRESVVK